MLLANVLAIDIFASFSPSDPFVPWRLGGQELMKTEKGLTLLLSLRENSESQ